MDTISSRSNPKVKELRALRNRKARQESGLMVVEGIRPIGEAVQANIAFEFILYSPDLLKSTFAHSLIESLTEKGVPCWSATQEIIESLAEKDNPQGILAVVHRPQHFLAQFSAHNFPWGVAMVDAQDPGNIGTLLRTIDAVGASGLLLLSSSMDGSGIADPYQPAVVRASMGTLFWKPIIQASFTEFVHWSKINHYHIFGTSAHAEINYQQVDHYPLPRILLLGSEREGLSAEQAAVCEQLIRLPMHGHATSLNVAVAGSILLYEMMKKS